MCGYSRGFRGQRAPNKNGVLRSEYPRKIRYYQSLNVASLARMIYVSFKSAWVNGCRWDYVYRPQRNEMHSCRALFSPNYRIVRYNVTKHRGVDRGIPCKHVYYRRKLSHISGVGQRGPGGALVDYVTVCGFPLIPESGRYVG